MVRATDGEKSNDPLPAMALGLVVQLPAYPGGDLIMPRVSDDLLNAMISAYCAKDGNEAGGCLHVVVDDGNHEGHFSRHCLERAKELCDQDAILIAEQLLRLSDRERFELLNPF